MPGVRGGQKDESAAGAWTWERNVSVAQGEQVLERTEDKYKAEQVCAAQREGAEMSMGRVK